MQNIEKIWSRDSFSADGSIFFFKCTKYTRAVNGVCSRQLDARTQCTSKCIMHVMSRAVGAIGPMLKKKIMQIAVLDLTNVTNSGNPSDLEEISLYQMNVKMSPSNRKSPSCRVVVQTPIPDNDFSLKICNTNPL